MVRPLLVPSLKSAYCSQSSLVAKSARLGFPSMQSKFAAESVSRSALRMTRRIGHEIRTGLELYEVGYPGSPRD